MTTSNQCFLENRYVYFFIYIFFPFDSIPSFRFGYNRDGRVVEMRRLLYNLFKMTTVRSECYCFTDGIY